ncbi:MAG TPA: carboxylesterase family protein [Bryobacteraceae bacterium]
MKTPMNVYHLCCALGMAAFAAGTALAQVPPNIEADLRKIGQIVDPPCTAKLYRPLMPPNDVNGTATPLYPGITVARDVSFGPNPKDVVDIFTADKGRGNRPVLMYIPGGAGNKIEQQDREANAFYDNIMRWATQNGMVGVNMQRHPGPDWDSGGKDVSLMIQWVEANIAKYKGNPDRMFIWAQSAGNGPLGIYIGRPELRGPKGVGVKGAIFMSGQFNILPVVPAAPAGGRGGGDILAGAGSTCGLPAGAAFSNAGAIAGPSRADDPPARGGRGGGGGFGRGPQVDAATQLARSSLPALKTSTVKIMLATAELDPGISGNNSAFNQALHDELCKAGPDHCPTMLFEKGESHMSEVFSIDTPDKVVSGPILKFIKSIK